MSRARMETLVDRHSFLGSEHPPSDARLPKIQSPFLGGAVFGSSAAGPHHCASTVNATVEGRSSACTVSLPPTVLPKVLNAKQGNSMYDFSSLWYDSIGNWIQYTSYKAVILPPTRGKHVRSK